MCRTGRLWPRLYAHTTSVPAPTTPRTARRLALAHAPTAPGSQLYSLTDYVLPGLVVKKVTGRSYAAEAKASISVPLGLTGISSPGARATLPSPYGRRAPATVRQIGTMSGAPSRAASAVWSSGCRCDSRSASTLFS
ncbi:hypothetical protein ACFU76_22660 [Streptomyces sp. NPDC057539]|uniref:hypothetical protein n=1 Tax=Streptomyces sp. NPDC057539 TaxID=3346159 RepID=UPI0036740F57